MGDVDSPGPDVGAGWWWCHQHPTGHCRNMWQHSYTKIDGMEHLEVSKVMGVPQFMDGLQWKIPTNKRSKWMIWGYPYFVLGNLHLQESVLWNSMVSMIFPLTPTQWAQLRQEARIGMSLHTAAGIPVHLTARPFDVFTGKKNDPGTKCH